MLINIDQGIARYSLAKSWHVMFTFGVVIRPVVNMKHGCVRGLCAGVPKTPW